MNNDTLAELELSARRLAAAIGDAVRWEWESRFEVMLTVIKRDQAEAVEGHLMECFGARWSHESTDKPTHIDELAADMGMRSGQLLFTTAPEGTDFLFCAWWPWGGGDQISLRIGFWPPSDDEKATATLNQELQSWLAGAS